MDNRVIIFDFDGPIAESFSEHQEFVLQMAEKYNMRHPLPNVGDDRWKKLSSHPPQEFFRNCGFCRRMANMIHDGEYMDQFGNRLYARQLQPGVGTMLASLKRQGHRLAIVSLNLRANIIKTIDDRGLAGTFDIVYACEDFPQKSPALTYASMLLGSNPERAVFVGDTLGDFRAAQAVRMPFIGVRYGWQIDGSEPDFPSAASVEELENMLAFCENG